MKKILIIIAMLPMLSYGQGLFVATSSSTDLFESNMGSSFTGSESIVVSSLTMDEVILDNINEDINSNKLISIYPNPCTDLVTIKSDFTNIEVFTINGKHIESIVSYNKQVSLRHLENGSYFISVFNRSTYIGTTKLNKQ